MKEKKKFLWILLVSIINFITFVIYSIYVIDNSKILNLWPIDISSLSIFSYLILKIKLYKHHYLTIIDIIVGKYESVKILNNIIILCTEISFCLTYTTYKYIMLKKYVRSYEILFYEGLIELSLSIIL